MLSLRKNINTKIYFRVIPLVLLISINLFLSLTSSLPSCLDYFTQFSSWVQCMTLVTDHFKQWRNLVPREPCVSTILNALRWILTPAWQLRRPINFCPRSMYTYGHPHIKFRVASYYTKSPHSMYLARRFWLTGFEVAIN